MKLPSELWGLVWWALACFSFVIGGVAVFDGHPEASLIFFGQGAFHTSISLLYLINWIKK